MKWRILSLLLILNLNFFAQSILAQTNVDALKKSNKISHLDSSLNIYTFLKQWTVYNNNADIGYSNVWLPYKPFFPPSKDQLFYIMASLVLLLGFIKTFFSKYFTNLFTIFFQVTFKQKSIREQLLQNSLPSVLLNILFYCTGGFYLYFLFAQNNSDLLTNNILLSVASWIALLLAVYGSKLIILKFCSWLFQLDELSSVYIFIVFMINKVAGVLLLPVVIFLAFGPSPLNSYVINISLTIIALLFIYRYIISYPLIKTRLRLNQFHFFLYLCCFEIIPVLLIYKGCVIYF